MAVQKGPQPLRGRWADEGGGDDDFGRLAVALLTGQRPGEVVVGLEGTWLCGERVSRVTLGRFEVAADQRNPRPSVVRGHAALRPQRDRLFKRLRSAAI